jgi:3-oxoacyl-[acyl-carrier-protein] synthase III
MGLETALGWLAIDEGRHIGAVVAAEKWAFTVDREDYGKHPMWAHSDGACAMVVGASPSGRDPIARYSGLSVTALPEMNGFVKIKYGGTRHPVQEGDNPFERQLRGIPKRDLFPKYMQAFSEVIDARRAGESRPSRQAVCNQISPNVVTAIEKLLGFEEGRVPRTGMTHGHVGGCDSVLGLEELLGDARSLDEPVMLLASSPYTFAAASLYPPE